MTAPQGDPRLFVVERGGTIKVRARRRTPTQFLDIHTLTTPDGERGLLSMAFDPNYASNGLFYVFYTGDGTDSGGAVRASVHVDEFHVSSNPDVADASSRRQVLIDLADPRGQPTTTVASSSSARTGILYISVGDGGTGGQPPSNLDGR